MARRVSLPDRGIKSEDAGLTSVDDTRTKSGSLSSDDGEGLFPKQGKFFKNLSRSLDPAAPAPKKKDYMEEYHKYKAKRALHLHGVVKQQTIDLGTLGLSDSTTSENAQSRRFSTGMNPPQNKLDAQAEAKSATLPATTRGKRGPPPPVAPRKKSVNLPVIAEPMAPVPKVTSPVHDTPSYILSALKKEQHKAENEVKKTVKPEEKPQSTEEVKEVNEPNQNNLPVDEKATPTEHGVIGSTGDDAKAVGSHVIESSIKEEEESGTDEQGGSPSDEKNAVECDVNAEEDSGKDSETVEEVTVLSDNVKDVVKEGEKKEEGGNDLSGKETTTMSEAPQESKIGEDLVVSEGGKSEETGLAAKNEVVGSSEEATKTEGIGEGKGEQIQEKEGENKEEGENEKGGDLENSGQQQEIITEDAESEKVLENGSENVVAGGKDEETKVPDEEKGDASVPVPTGVPSVKIDDVDAPQVTEDPTVQSGNVPESNVSEGDASVPVPTGVPSVKIDDVDAPQVTEDPTVQSGNVPESNVSEDDTKVPNGEVVSANGIEVGAENKAKDSGNINGKEDIKDESSKEEHAVPLSTESTPGTDDKAGTGKLSKTADLLLSFSQDKKDSAKLEDSDLSEIGEELKKLNRSIEELSQENKKTAVATKEDAEKLKEIEDMRKEMESMQKEMDLFG